MRIFGGPRIYNPSRKEKTRLKTGHEWREIGPNAWIQVKIEKEKAVPPPNFEGEQFNETAPKPPTLVTKKPISTSQAMADWEVSREREG